MGCTPGLQHKSYDWPLYKSEYISGVPIKEIAAKYNVNLGTIQVHATRKGWKQDRDKTATKRTDVVAKAVHDYLADDAKRFTKIVTKGIIQAADSLFQREIPDNPHEANSLVGAMQKVNDMGRKTFGLEGPGVTIAIGILGQAPEIVAPELPAIEIEATSSTVEPAAPATPEPDQQGS